MLFRPRVENPWTITFYLPYKFVPIMEAHSRTFLLFLKFVKNPLL